MTQPDRKDQLVNYPSDYAVCRVLVGNHSPGEFPTIYNAPGGYELVYTCQFCHTEISKFRDRRGFITGQRRYKYPAGYVMAEGGGITPSEKAALFLSQAGLQGEQKIRKGMKAP